MRKGSVENVYCKGTFPCFFSFIVALDCKGLLILMVKVDDEGFLSGQGLMVEFCIFSLASKARLSYYM